jgi:heme o synthase
MTDERATQPTTMSDLLTLTKFRLSALVIVSTLVGFWVASPRPVPWMMLIHTIIGSALAAFGAGVFNQLMEIGPDSRMTRTADRPLPAGRIAPSAAFGLGWLLSALGLIHLVHMVNVESAALTAATLATYLFVYTPLKQQSDVNTLVGAVSGALPPLIGWAGAAGPALPGSPYFRWQLLLEPGAIYLFALLFLWQLPHFLAINWMYRDQYRDGGFVMLANDDDNGHKTSLHALGYAIATFLLMFYPVLVGIVETWFLVPALLLAGWLCRLAWQFRKHRERPYARKLFFCTLMYLPAIFVVTVLAWR